MSYKSRGTYVLLTVVLMIVPLMILFPMYLKEKQSLQESILADYQRDIAINIGLLKEDQKRANLVLVTALSRNSEIENFLAFPETSPFPELLALSEALKQTGLYKEIGLHLIDKDGISVLRSWADIKGDSLLEKREDIAGMVANPQNKSFIRFEENFLSIRSIAPVFNKEHFVGMVEVVTQFDATKERLEKTKLANSALLIDMHHYDQLKNIPLDRIINGYVVLNESVSEEDLYFLKKLNLSRFLTEERFEIINNKFVFVSLIYGLDDILLGYWVINKPLELFDLQKIYNLKNRYLILSAFIVLLMALLSALFFYRRQAEFERQHFHQVFDTAAEIIFVSDREKVINANKAFFDVFSAFKDLDDFNNSYRCVGDSFVKEKGFLFSRMGKLHWYDYLLKHPNKTHYAKIKQYNLTQVYTVKAVEIISNTGLKLMSVFMNDVTEEERIKIKLTKLTTMDDLTGIFNRYYFNKTLAHEIERAHRYKLNLSLVSFDIDHFKKVNDTYGHDVGDVVLQVLAKKILENIRTTDLLCRVGGEEFSIIMPETPLDEAGNFAERLRHEVESLVFKEFKHNITISLGVVMLQEAESLQEIYKRADEALYLVKNTGRNRVVVDGQDKSQEK